MYLNKLAPISRGFSFVIAPALGYLALNISYQNYLNFFYLAFLFLYLSSFLFNLLRKYMFKNKTWRNKVIFAERFMGYLAFGML